MAIKSGFFNSVSGDRKYDAEDINKFFAGVITDGILSTIGDTLLVVPNSGLQVAIGSGKAWFLNSWIENTSDAYLTISTPDVTFGRIDIIAIDFDKSDQVRENDIIIVAGTPAASPVPPTLLDTATHLQKPLAHIQVDANETVIQEADITSKVDTVDCPFSTGITDLVVSVDDLTIEIVSNDLQVKAGGITASHIATGAVDTAELADNAVDGSKINVSSIDSDHYVNDSIDSAHYAPNSVNETALGVGVVGSTELKFDAVDGTKIQDNSINSEHYIDGSIDRVHLVNDIIDGTKIADNVVNSEHIAAGAIDNEHIGNDQVNSEHYAAESINAEHIADDTVDSTKIGQKVPKLETRQGGNSGNWDAPGATNYAVGNVKMHTGVISCGSVGAGQWGGANVTFPAVFSGYPIFIVSFRDGGEDVWLEATATTTTGIIVVFNNNSFAQTPEIQWLAIGNG